MKKAKNNNKKKFIFITSFGGASFKFVKKQKSNRVCVLNS